MAGETGGDDDAGEIWSADIADPRAPKVLRYRNVGLSNGIEQILTDAGGTPREDESRDYTLVPEASRR